MTQELPLGWGVYQLKELGEIVSGGTPNSSESKFWGDDISWITPADLSGYSSKYISKGRKGLSQLGYNNCSAKLLPAGSLLFSSRAPIGYVAIASNEIATNQGFKNIVPNTSVYSEFLYYGLKYVKHQAIDLACGTTFLEISGSKFGEISLPLPPLNEQRRIVAKLEALFSEVDAAVAQLRAVQQQLQVYRQAVLKAAFEGKLTAAWRAKQTGLPTAAELLADIHAERARQAQASGKKLKPVAPLTPAELAELPDLPEGWAWVRGKELGNWVGGGTPSTTVGEYWKGNIMWVSPKDMKDKIIHDTIDKITFSAVENSSTKLINPPAIVFVVRSGILRRVLPVAITKKSLTLNQDLQSLNPAVGNIDYLYWYFLSNENNIRDSCSKDGTTVESIEVDRLKRYQIAFPSLEEQDQIVQEIEARLSVADKLAEAVETSLRHAEALKQSLLHRAFQGKLVPQDPTDEPASALLARIRAERNEQPVKRGRRKKELA